MAINGTSTMKCLNKSTPKRKQVPSASSESDSRHVIKRNSKRTYTASCRTHFMKKKGEANMAIQETLQEIKGHFDSERYGD